MRNDKEQVDRVQDFQTASTSRGEQRLTFSMLEHDFYDHFLVIIILSTIKMRERRKKMKMKRSDDDE